MNEIEELRKENAELRNRIKLISTPLTDDKILSIGRELGIKCRLGGNANIDFDYARAIETAHGITCKESL